MMLNEQVVATGQLREDGLYVLEIASAMETALLTKTTISMDEWHKVLGHPSKERLLKLLEDPELGIVATGQLSPCTSCIAGKGEHASHRSLTTEEAKEIGERVHVDLGFIF